MLAYCFLCIFVFAKITPYENAYGSGRHAYWQDTPAAAALAPNLEVAKVYFSALTQEITATAAPPTNSLREFIFVNGQDLGARGSLLRVRDKKNNIWKVFVAHCKLARINDFVLNTLISNYENLKQKAVSDISEDDDSEPVEVAAVEKLCNIAIDKDSADTEKAEAVKLLCEKVARGDSSVKDAAINQLHSVCLQVRDVDQALVAVKVLQEIASTGPDSAEKVMDPLCYVVNSKDSPPELKDAAMKLLCEGANSVYDKVVQMALIRLYDVACGGTSEHQDEAMKLFKERATSGSEKIKALIMELLGYIVTNGTPAHKDEAMKLLYEGASGASAQVKDAAMSNLKDIAANTGAPELKVKATDLLRKIEAARMAEPVQS